jgi:hypothetical protein
MAVSSALAATFSASDTVNWKEWLKMPHNPNDYIDFYFIGSQSYKTSKHAAHIHPVFIKAHAANTEIGLFYHKPQIDEIIVKKNPAYRDVKISVKKGSRIDEGVNIFRIYTGIITHKIDGKSVCLTGLVHSIPEATQQRIMERFGVMDCLKRGEIYTIHKVARSVIRTRARRTIDKFLVTAIHRIRA